MSNKRQKLHNMAQKVEKKWDGIASVAATIGIVVVTLSGIHDGLVGGTELFIATVALSGIAGFSLHNAVSRQGGER